MTAHTVDHDPTLDHGRCETCNALLRRALVRLADRIMGPRDADELMAAIRAEVNAVEPEVLPYDPELIIRALNEWNPIP